MSHCAIVWKNLQTHLTGGFKKNVNLLDDVKEKNNSLVKTVSDFNQTYTTLTEFNKIRKYIHTNTNNRVHFVEAYLPGLFGHNILRLQNI